MRSFVVVGLLLFACASTYGATTAKIITLGDVVTIYSGPSRGFRPIRSIEEKAEFLASSQIVHGNDGEYYKVLVKFKNGGRQIGYVRTDGPVKIQKLEGESEDIEGYSPLYLANSQLQIAFYILKNSRMYWSAGYSSYIFPDFYWKPFVGQFLTDSASSVLLGAAIGTDHLVDDTISFFAELGAGALFAPRVDAIFNGSEAANAVLQGSAGLRFNVELAAVGVGLGQSAVFNGNNSYIGWNVGFTLEVGL